MKYMGSKAWMLRNGLGELLAEEVGTAVRFIDLFAGSAAVATHVAAHFKVPVIAYDLQCFSRILAGAVLHRVSKLDSAGLWRDWYARAAKIACAVQPPYTANLTKETVRGQRKWSAAQKLTLTRCYGGFYFSAQQAVWLDALRLCLPEQEPGRTVALAALISAASKCAAAPGHTAQPFQPTRGAKPFLAESWSKSIMQQCETALRQFCQQHAQTKGVAETEDANLAATCVCPGDLVFIDPPYSGVHYSRFYHVLETLARGQCGEVSGAGRYPPRAERPRSRYSVKSESKLALSELLDVVASRGGRAILTFPQRRCSNGLSGMTVTEIAGKYFQIKRYWVASRFSTLGGNNDHRNARRDTRELILALHPKPSSTCPAM